MAKQCELKGAVYDWNCNDCMERKMVAARSPDGKTSRRIQLGILGRIGSDRAGVVLAMIKVRSE